jgi:L-amino acid N-acyltransferase YncA
MSTDDWPVVRAIYEEGLATGNATLESGAPEWETWDRAHSVRPRLVALAGGRVIGWAALSPVSVRPVYRGVAEVSIYIAAGARGRGFGYALLSALVSASETEGFWTLQASILADNATSVALHQRCGFRVVGRRERIAQRNGVWRDTLLLERRSATV